MPRFYHYSNRLDLRFPLIPKSLPSATANLTPSSNHANHNFFSKNLQFFLDLFSKHHISINTQPYATKLAPFEPSQSGLSNATKITATSHCQPYLRPQ
jgi:hypothetical protein